MKEYDHKTIEYKKLNGSQSVLLDVYFPPLGATKDVISLPVIINFHAGGLCVGNRKTWLPTWLIDRVLPLGYAFISADYRLLIPGSAQETIEDLQDVFKFVANTEIRGDNYTFKLDQGRVGVCGGSSGGLCSYLSVIHCSPKPKFVLSFYGMGGDYLTDLYMKVKPGEITTEAQTGIPVDAALVANLTYPYSNGIPKSVTDAPFDGALSEDIIPRMNAFYAIYQRGLFLDYYTGLHEPRISEKIRTILKDENHTSEESLRLALPKEKYGLFPQLFVDPQWPPTLMLHGIKDDIILIDESRKLSTLLKDAGVRVELIEIEDEKHGFDVLPEAEQKHGPIFDKAKDFVGKYL